MIQLDSSVPRKNTIREKRPFGWTELLFILGLVIYLATRFIALDKFPVYFFSDEAIQTELAGRMIENGFNDASEQIPIYFENGGQYNLSLSVWLQALVAPFERSIWLTRGISALLTVIFPLTLGLALRDFFKIKYWWLAPFIVSVIPAWFLHSRTAFETALGTALFCAFLYFYLCYRLQDRDFLPVALLFGALTFYAYAPLQLVVVLCGLLMLIIDWSYHFKDKKVPWLGIITLLILALPYVLFRIRHPESLGQHLSILQSYWAGTAPLGNKLGEFFSRYLKGLDPRYWFLPNHTDLIRHQMKDMAHFPLLLSPFIALGIVKVLTKLKEPAWRLALIALLIAPSGAALADVAITRNLVIVVPLAMLACLGLDSHLRWLADKRKKEIILVLLVVLSLIASTAFMTYSAISKGPTWYKDYGLYGMQWGGKELSAEIKALQTEHPEKKVIVSPTWANNTDVILSFFLGDPLPVEVNSINDWIFSLKELNKNMVFVMPPEELKNARASDKFADIEVVHSLNWPNGETGFYFVTLRYVDNVQEIFDREAIVRSQPEDSVIRLFDQDVQVSHSLLDIGHISNVFDGDSNTLIRGLEANPLNIKLVFEKPIEMRGLRLLIGLPPSVLIAEIKVAGDGKLLHSGTQSLGFENNDWLETYFAGSYMVEELKISLQENTANKQAHIHIWEIEFIH